MARIVLVFGHPSQDSLSAAIRDRAAASLRAAGHHVDVLDLGAIGFTPAMTPAERAAYHTATPVIDPVVAAHAELVKRADALLFVYPTWWSGLPAILKGWLDRLMVPTVAFSFDADNRLVPGLRNVRLIGGISTYGSPWRYQKLVCDNGRRILHRTLRTMCARRCRRRWLALYTMDTRTREECAAFIDRAGRSVVRWAAAL